MASVDTNVLVRLLIEDDEDQARQAAAFLRTSGRVFISQIVLVEATWVLASVYGLTREQIGHTLVDYAHKNSAITVIATHSQSLARLCDRLLVLEGGRIG